MNSAFKEKMDLKRRGIDSIHSRRTFMILIIWCVVQLAGTQVFSQTATLSLDMKNVSVEEVLNVIEAKTIYRFLYNKQLIDVSRKVTIVGNKQEVSQVLNEVFKGTNVAYSINGKQIVLSRNEEKSSSQTLNKISGIVTDQNGVPIIGASVMEKGTKNGTITDINGNFSLDISNQSALTISSIGYTTLDFSVGTQKSVMIKMEEDVKILEPVVVIGYGTQKKVSLTGSVASTSGESVQKSSSFNISQSMAGRIPGMIVNNRSGEPGADAATIYIRGRSTLGDNSPLIIVDGIADRETLDRINPNDIESITVLKDASAAIYGARSANGVILVTTKRGKVGKPDVTFSFDMGLQSPTRVIEVCDAVTYAQIYNEVSSFEGSGAAYSNEEIQKFRDGSDPVLYPNTDWFKEIIKPVSVQSKYNISVNGGSEIVKYFVSAGVNIQDGIYNNGATKFSQLNIRSNIDVNVTKNFKIGFDLAPRIQWKNYSPFSSDGYGIFYITKRMKPTSQARYPNGYLAPGTNPLVLVSDIAGYNKSTLNRLNTTLTAQWDLSTVFQGLSVEGHVAYDNTSTFNKQWSKPWNYWNYIAASDIYEEKTSTYFPSPRLYEIYTPTNSLTLNAIINYQRNFNNKHNVGVMLGFEQNKYRSDYFSTQRDQYPSDAIDELFAGDADKNFMNNNGSASVNARQSYFGRATYDYKSKYLAQVIFRYDGSENFPKDKRWGLFPSISLGWRMSEEGFIKNNFDFINNLKLRFSYGEQGNDRINAFQYLTSYSYTTNKQIFGGLQQNGIVPGTIPNENVTWEVAKTYNLGLDGNLWGGKLGFEFELFKTNRTNILCTRNASIPTYTGLTNLPDENIGIVKNKGLELQLSHANKWNEFNYRISGNILYARNTVVYMDEVDYGEGHDYMKLEGKPMGSQLLYQVIGLNKTAEDLTNNLQMKGARLGDFIFLDADGNGIINSYDRIRQDQTPVPEIVYGLTCEGSWKNFDFMVLFQGQARVSQYVYPQIEPAVGNIEKYATEDRWTTDNPNGSRPRLSSTINNGSPTPSTYYFYTASFLRIKNLEIGYTLPSKLIEHGGVKNMRVYIGGYNLLTFSKLDFIDPEASSSEAQTYPQVRIINAGVKVTF